MTSASNYTFVPAPSPQPNGFTANRQSQLPSHALHAGGSAMPPAWQTRNAPYYDGQRHDAPVRNLADIVLDPWRFVTATKLRKALFVGAITLLALIILL